MALFPLDGLADALGLLLMLRLCGVRIHPGRVGLAALLGAVTAQIIRVSGVPGRSAMLLWLPLTACMARLAGGPEIRLLRGGLTLLAAYGLLGGVIQALYGATGSLAAAWGLGIASALVMAASALRARRASHDVERVRVICRYREHAATFEAMVDSGNCLRDYLTHRPVIVLPEAWAREHLNPAGTGLRPIFANTAGGRQMMWCMIPEETTIELGRTSRQVDAAVALAPGLRESALLPAVLLAEK